MTITFPRELPASLKVAKGAFTLDVNDSVFESGISRKANIQSHGAGVTDRWTGELSTNNLSRADWLELTAWIVSLKGRQGTFLVHDPDREFPQTFISGSFPGTGLVNGSGQSGNSLLTDGWPTSSTILKAGDMFQQGVESHMLTEDALTDVGGQVRLQFEPAIRNPPAINTVIKTTRAQIIARRISSTIPFSTEEVAFLPITIGFEEVL